MGDVDERFNDGGRGVDAITQFGEGLGGAGAVIALQRIYEARKVRRPACLDIVPAVGQNGV